MGEHGWDVAPSGSSEAVGECRARRAAVDGGMCTPRRPGHPRHDVQCRQQWTAGDLVLPEYRAATVRPLLVGSGRALDMLAAQTADVVISHAPARETAALASHPDWLYRKILYNDFLIVGPA